MRTTFLVIVLLWSMIASLYASAASAQNALDKKISIELKNVILKDALNKIAGMANVSFVYISSNALDNVKVNIKVRDKKVAVVLTMLLSPHDLSYKVIDDRVVIHSASAPPSASAFADSVSQQLAVNRHPVGAIESLGQSGGSPTAPRLDIDVKGVIYSEKGAPLYGVSVLVKGTKRGAATNSKGEFEIKNVPSDAVLVISVTGYKTEEVPVASIKNGVLDIKLKESAAVLQDVVVTGFQNVDKKKFAGAAVHLDMDEIKQDGVADVSRMLEGRAAGVSVENVSGTFGSAPKIRIRGATSINGDNKPLWVVDGVVLEDVINISNDQLSSGDPTTLLGSAVAGLNANDIESFEILKDAAATALYGARAMNGVVVITTKKGRVGRTVVSYTGNYSTQLKPSYGNFDIMNSGLQMSILGEEFRKKAFTPNIVNNSDWGVVGLMQNEIDAADTINGTFGLPNTRWNQNAFLLKYAKVNTDWFGLLFRNNFMQEHSLSVSFGSDKSQSYFSTSYYGDNGWTIADKVSRYTLNFRNNYKFNDRLSGGFSTVGSVRQQRAPGSVTRQADPVEGQYSRDFDINPFSYALNTSRAMTPYDDQGNFQYYQRNFAPFNIVNELANNYLQYSIVDLRLQGELSYKVAKHLKYDFLGALRYVKSTREDEITENSNMANAYRADQNATIAAANKFLYTDPANPDLPPQVVLPYGGFYNRTEDALTSFDVRNSLNWTQTLAEKHTINILGGQQIKYADRQEASNTGYGYQYNSGGTVLTDYQILKSSIESNFPYFAMSKNRDRFVAFYSSAAYTYDNRLNFTGTLRYDGSNQLGSNPRARWLPTWSLAGSWNIEQEKWMQSKTWIDYATLRMTYGLTGSMGPATNSDVVLKNQNTNRPYSDEVESVIALIDLEDKDLTWEKLYTYNIGLDGGLFDKRLTFSLDAYKRKSFDLISLIKTPGIGGEAIKAANYADMNSQGIELLVGGDVIRRKNWGWKTSLTFGYNTTKITNAKNNPMIFDLVIPEGGNKQGYPVHSLFSLKYTSLAQQTGVPSFINESGQVSPAVYLQSETTDYLKYEGAVDPIYTGGFSNTFHYKAWSTNIFVTYQAGNKIRLYPSFQNSYTDFGTMPKEFWDRWMLPGDSKYSNIPSIMDNTTAAQNGGAYPLNNYNYSTERIARGDMIRLKTVSVTYTMPPAVVKRSGMSNASLTLAATNLWLLYSDSKLKGQDPEFFNSGGVAQPLQRQVTMALKVSF